MAVNSKKKSAQKNKTSTTKQKTLVAAKKVPAVKKIKTAAPVKKAVIKKTAPVATYSRPAVPRPSAFGVLSGQNLPPRVQAMLDKSEIHEIIVLFARALDRMDDTLLRSVFHPEASLDFGTGVFQGSSNDYVVWALGVIGHAKSTHHLLGQTRSVIEGDSAFSETYAQIHFRSDKPTGREDLFMGVRYLDRLERRPSGSAGVWKIAHRKQIIDWVRTEAVSDLFFHQNPDALWNFRSKTDPSYQIGSFPSAQPSLAKAPSFLGKRYDAKSFRA